MNNRTRNRIVDEQDSTDSKISLEVLLSGLKVPAGKPKEVVWQAIIEKIDNQKEVKVIRISTVILRVAASLIIFALLGGSIWIWGFSSIEIYSPNGQQMTILLPDSSSVNLNADTRIRYNKSLWKISRKVKIEGEGMFKVKKGNRFDVIADGTTTSVLGTTFNVYNRKGKIEVSCIEGKVSVESNKTNEKVVLKAGYKTEVKKEIMNKPIEIKEKIEVKWTQGEFYFINKPVREVFDELERQFDVDVFYEGNPNRPYTGYFNNNDLSIALGLVCIPMDFKYNVNGNVVIVRDNFNKQVHTGDILKY